MFFQYAVFFHVQVGTKQRKIIFCGELDIFFGAGRKVQPVTQLYHQRVGVGGRLDADARCKRLSICIRNDTVAVRLRCGHSAQGVTRDVFRGGELIVLYEYLLVIRQRSDAVSVLAAFHDHIVQNKILYHGAYTVMDDKNILRAADIRQIFDAVANGFLGCTAAGNDPLQLVNTKLLGVCPQYLVPAVKANDLNGVDLGIALKPL